MAYYSKNKTYTDHPLMDEICYYCKQILKGIVVKNDVLANKSETEQSLQHGEMFILQYEDDLIPFDHYPFTLEILEAFGYSEQAAKSYLLDRNNIPEEDREDLTIFANKWFSDRFEEENDYYRSMMGLPPFDTGEEYYIYINDLDIPAKYNKEIDYSIPLHEQPNDIINLLYAYGVIDELRKTYPGSAYNYMNFLGDKKLDLYKLRTAGKWDILYMPNVYYLVEDRFTEIYNTNKEIFLNRHYQEFYASNSDYYDQEMIILLLAQCFGDLISEIPEWYIRRDIFDIRSCEYFLTSYGVTFFEEIPLKYQIKLVKNVNKLIKYKSSNKNIDDIIDIFNGDVEVYKYWLYKKRKVDSEGNYTQGDTNRDLYELEFIASDKDESYDDYIKDKIFRTPYDDITYADKYWDGENTHSLEYDKHLDLPFTIEGTKYMSIEYAPSFTDYSTQIEYFLGMILDSQINFDDIRIPVPSIDEFVTFRVSDLFLMLVILTNLFYKVEEDNNYERPPESTSIGSIPKYSEETGIYDWKKRIMPEIFVLKNGRTFGFNSKFDREAMENLIKTKRHSYFLFGASYNNCDYDNPGQDTPLTDEEYAERASTLLDDLYINQYVIPQGAISTLDDFVGIYKNNVIGLNTVKEYIRTAQNQDDKKLFEYVYQELYTREYDDEFYVLSDGTRTSDLVTILKDRDFILWDQLKIILAETNIEERKRLIRGIMNDVIDTLQYYLHGEGLEYIFTFTATDSLFSLVYYIYLVLNFFKSYKVQFLDPYAGLTIDDPLNNCSPIDRIAGMKKDLPKPDKAFSSDALSVNPELEKKDSGTYDNFIEFVDIFTHQDDDYFDDTDFNGGTAETSDSDCESDIDGGIADSMMNVPYVDLNGGSSQLGKRNIDDLDGGNADDRYHDYVDIDGGEAFHQQDLFTDYFGRQGFNYELDGGSAGPFDFYNNSVYIRLAPRIKNEYNYKDRDNLSRASKIYDFYDIGENPFIVAQFEDESFEFGDITEGTEDPIMEGNYEFYDICEIDYYEFTEDDYVDDLVFDFGDYNRITFNENEEEYDIDFGDYGSIYNRPQIPNLEGDYNYKDYNSDIIIDPCIDDSSVIVNEHSNEFNDLSLREESLSFIHTDGTYDDGIYNFGDIDEGDETADGDYDFIDVEDGNIDVFFGDQEYIWEPTYKIQNVDFNEISKVNNIQYNHLYSEEFLYENFQGRYSDDVYDFVDINHIIEMPNKAIGDINFNELDKDHDPEPEKEPDYGIEIIADINVSKKMDYKIQIHRDGLYIPDVYKDEDGTYEEIEDIVNSVLDAKGHGLFRLASNIHVLTSEDLVKERINSLLDKYLQDILYINDLFDSRHKFENRIIDLVNYQAAKLNERYSKENIHVYEWEDLD